MNTLGYAILSVFSRKPCSGYQLASSLEVLWPARHSQIYPLLTKMEKRGLLEYEHIEQTSRPNKKIYSITDKGMETLRSWINESPNDRIKRDEFLIKVYSIWLTDADRARELIEDRISKLKEKVALRETKIEEAATEEKEHLTISSKHFGRYALLNRSNFLDKEEISWCNWVLGLFEDSQPTQ